MLTQKENNDFIGRAFCAVVLFAGKEVMDTRIAAISIIVTDAESVEKINQLLHENRNTIIGRMGIPYREKNVSIISIAMDAPMNQINALTGKLGRLHGVQAKAAYV